MNKNIEKKVARTILDRPLVARVADTALAVPLRLQIGEHEFVVPAPTMATMIAAGEYISELPAVKLSEQDILTEALAVSPDCRPIGKVAAILVLGADDTKRPFRMLKRRKSKEIDRMADYLLRSLTPSQMLSLIRQILDVKTIGDFFGITTSLIEANLLRRTRKTEEVE